MENYKKEYEKFKTLRKKKLFADDLPFKINKK